MTIKVFVESFKVISTFARQAVFAASIHSAAQSPTCSVVMGQIEEGKPGLKILMLYRNSMSINVTVLRSGRAGCCSAAALDTFRGSLTS